MNFMFVVEGDCASVQILTVPYFGLLGPFIPQFSSSMRVSLSVLFCAPCKRVEFSHVDDDDHSDDS